MSIPCAKRIGPLKTCGRPIWFLWPNFYQNHREQFLHGPFLVFISWNFSCNKSLSWCHKCIRGGVFRFTKVISNNCSILQALPTNNVSQKLTEINLSLNDILIEPALRILWNPKTDIFHVKYTFKSVLATKWGILFLLSSIFDPLQLIAPALIKPKWIIQQL